MYHLIRVADLLAPLTAYTRNKTNDSFKTPAVIKRKMNQRKKLIAKLKLNPDESMKQRLKNMNVEIRNHFYERKKHNIRRNIIPGMENPYGEQ